MDFNKGNFKKNYPYVKLKKERYNSFDSGNGAMFKDGKLT